MERVIMDGALFQQMIVSGANRLKKHVEQVDALNVFPVPDGDTGTNMNLSFQSGVEELKKSSSPHIGQAASALSRGVLMGARGNSGVILSQLFRGFSATVKEKQEINAREFSVALAGGVETAYKAVMKPVEGTILTVAREAAEASKKAARQSNNLVEVMDLTLQAARQSLQRTPELLAVLKEVGVVDSGGQGLVYIYEGFLAALKGEEVIDEITYDHRGSEPISELVEQVHAQTKLEMKAEDIEYGYCTEFMIRLGDRPTAAAESFDEKHFRRLMEEWGDSLLVVSDDELVKVHIHAEHPGEVLNIAQKYGSLQRIKIENMRDQFETIVETSQPDQTEKKTVAPSSPYGIIAVAAGEGIADIFKSLGVNTIVEGGQTMNPSTEDILKVAQNLDAETIIILPNNSNIVMAAEQAGQLLEKPVLVIPSKTVPQGISAMLAYKAHVTPDENKKLMTEALQLVKTGQVTHAVRDTKMDNMEIREGDYIGIADGTIRSTSSDLNETTRILIQEMVDEDDEVLTVITGEDADPEHVRELMNWISAEYPELEAEEQYGGQPLYPYIISIE